MVSQQQQQQLQQLEHEPSQHMKVALKGIKIHLGCPRPSPPSTAAHTKAPGERAGEGGG